MMKNLPLLTNKLAEGPEAGYVFERLMKKLLINDGGFKNYAFEPGVTYRDSGVDGYVKKGYPGMDCPVVFQFKWLTKPINKKEAAGQIKKSLTKLVESDIDFKSYVLVTPANLKGSEKKWLDKLPAEYEKKFDICHMGHDHILVLMDAYPALKKYFYGEMVEGVSKNFTVVAGQYRKQIIEEVKHLQFIGLPTRNYDKQHNMETTELAKVYIPLDFMAEMSGSKRIPLQELLIEENRVVVLGDPGTGKSTLAKYLALVHCHEVKGKIPFIIPIREYIRQWQERKEVFNFIDYLKFMAEDHYSFNNIDKDFFEAKLVMGEAIVLFDGLDEVASETGRADAAKKIGRFASLYPESQVWITSRIVGYNVNVKLDEKSFNHYYLAPVTDEQAATFVEKWYEVQIPRNKTLCRDHIKSLQEAMEENPGVKRLKTNPLLLTMMTLVHQFEGTLPDDRATLYARCIELLLRTWQEPKYIALGIKNPMEERDLNYDQQKRLLAATAFYLQQKNQDSQDQNSRGLIGEKELTKVLFETRFDEKRMTREKAKEDIKMFLNYIRDRSGLLVEKGRNEKKENLFAFVHLSFLEYLCAYQMAEDKERSKEEHIRQLLEYLEKPAWEEPILLSLHLYSRSTGASFIDDFCEVVFKKLDTVENKNSWYLLGRAVRDNIDLSRNDIERIIKNILKIWISDIGNETARAVLKEIFNFSKKGYQILKEAIEENIKNEPAAKAFSAIFLYNQLYHPSAGLPKLIKYNNDKDLLAYLLLYQPNDPALQLYIDKTIKERQWFLYYYNAPDRMDYNLNALLKERQSPLELKGYIFSCWAKVLAAFNMRNQFLDKNEPVLEGGGLFDCMQFRFDNHAEVISPVNLFMAFNPYVGEITVPAIKNSHNISLEAEDSSGFINPTFFSNWLLELFFNISPIIKSDSEKSSYISKRVNQFSRDFSQDFIREMNREIKTYFSQVIDRDFLQNIGQNISADTIKKIVHSFIDKFIRKSKLDSINTFSLNIGLHLSSEINLSLKKLDRRTMGKIIHSAIDLTKSFFYSVYGQDLFLYDFGEDSEQFERAYEIYVDKFKNPNFPYTHEIYKILDKVVLKDFEMVLDKRKEMGSPNRFSFPIKNPIVIPVIFKFILSGFLSHYSINIIAYLNTVFHGKNEKEIENGMVANAVDEFLKKDPFEFYFINFFWNFYAVAFNRWYAGGAESESKELAFACFLMNAARVSLVADVPPEGSCWKKVLEEAGKYKSPLVQISLTLYKLCNFQQADENSILLDEQLAEFKREYPDYYHLMGFNG
ncbi:MAG: hypothetical protein KAT34_17805 [Candidatus Aminicenantes bacterium]|nr:hypothetical protein [Candidatus Aminicenantes bacterium]